MLVAIGSSEGAPFGCWLNRAIVTRAWSTVKTSRALCTSAGLVEPLKPLCGSPIRSIAATPAALVAEHVLISGPCSKTTSYLALIHHPDDVCLYPINGLPSEFPWAVFSELFFVVFDSEAVQTPLFPWLMRETGPRCPHGMALPDLGDGTPVRWPGGCNQCLCISDATAEPSC